MVTLVPKINLLCPIYLPIWSPLFAFCYNPRYLLPVLVVLLVVVVLDRLPPLAHRCAERCNQVILRDTHKNPRSLSQVPNVPSCCQTCHGAEVERSYQRAIIIRQ